jgi:predicted Zn-dependent peptidase
MPHETIVHTVLSNGLQVKLKPQSHQRTVSLGMFIAHGSKDENPSTNGIAHYIEHVRFNTKHMPRQLRHLIDRLLSQGASYQAHTSKDYTRFSITCLPYHLEQSIRILSLLAKNRRISAQAVDHERPIILHEHSMHFSSNKALGELLDYSFWGERSLGLFVIGSRNNIQQFTRDALEQRVRHYYTPERTQLVALGPVDPQRLTDSIAQHLDDWRSIPNDLPEPEVETEPRVSSIPTSSPRAELLLGYLGVPFRSADRYVAELLADILGGGMQSRLFLELREKRKLAYLIHAYTLSYSLGGYVAVRVDCKVTDLKETCTLIRQELASLARGGVSDAELARAKAARNTAVLRVLEDSSQHLQLLGRNAVLGKDFFVDLETRRYDGVQPDHIVRLAREIFVPDNLAIACIGPGEEKLLELL